MAAAAGAQCNGHAAWVAPRPPPRAECPAPWRVRLSFIRRQLSELESRLQFLPCRNRRSAQKLTLRVKTSASDARQLRADAAPRRPARAGSVSHPNLLGSAPGAGARPRRPTLGRCTTERLPDGRCDGRLSSTCATGVASVAGQAAGVGWPPLRAVARRCRADLQARPRRVVVPSRAVRQQDGQPRLRRGRQARFRLRRRRLRQSVLQGQGRRQGVSGRDEEARDRRRGQGRPVLIDVDGLLGDPDARRACGAIDVHKRVGRGGRRSAAAASASTPTARARPRSSASTRRGRAACWPSSRAEHGIDVLIENHGGVSSDGAWLAALVEEIGHPRVGTLPDFGNWSLGDGKLVRPLQGCRRADAERQGRQRQGPSFDAQGNETQTDFPKMLKIVVDGGFKGRVPRASRTRGEAVGGRRHPRDEEAAGKDAGGRSKRLSAPGVGRSELSRASPLATPQTLC